MSFHKQTFHQSSKPSNSDFIKAIKDVFGNPNPLSPLEIQHTGESNYFQVMTHSTNVAFQQGIDLEQLLLDYNVYVTGFGYTATKGIIIHFMRY